LVSVGVHNASPVIVSKVNAGDKLDEHPVHLFLSALVVHAPQDE
jgi:hypothetical protein